jgi:hypothetical protein
MQCEWLQNNFFNMQKVELACQRFAIEFTPIEMTHSDMSITQWTLEDFFERLRRTRQTKFVEFIQYMVRNVFAQFGPAPNWDQVNQTHFDDFMTDLQALGFKYTWRGGTNVSVTPMVLGGELEAHRVDELDVMLGKINPELVETRKGAWNALVSNGEDSKRQAIASSRQLLAETLRLVGKGEHRADKVRSILSGRDAEMVETVADLVDSIYNLMSKGEHEEPTFDRAFYVIELTEYSLHFLLKNRPEG